MLTEELQEAASQYLMHTYDRLPLSIIRGRGCHVYDAEGREYLDCIGGIAVNVLGHCHPDLVYVIQQQARLLIHTSNLFYTEPQVELARLLVEHSFADKVFFCNSGAEANEAAIKLARRYAYERYGPTRFEIVTMYNSFHGRTLATLSATGQPKLQEGFGPLLPGFRQVPLNDITALEAAITDQTAAVMIEPIQAEGGMYVAEKQYLHQVRQLCDQRDILLIFDEVQTGMGRTGTLFAYEHFDVAPDIMTLAKGLGGGVPIGACLAIDRVAEVFRPGTHASTFGGNPLACAAAIEVFRLLFEGKELEASLSKGRYLTKGLDSLKEQYAVITERRGIGLLQGIEVLMDARAIVTDCLARRIIVHSTKGNVLRLSPPFVITLSEIDRALNVLSDILAKHVSAR
ncbi:MAG: aspartate aminotransferase family protein [Nitrospirae bacterium]|nr:MAG: aspartate aminotransferase family protein [Nitrospirota bacterium]